MNQQLELLPRNTEMLTIFCVTRKFPNFEEDVDEENAAVEESTAKPKNNVF